MERREFLKLTAGAAVFTAACQKGTAASVPKISPNEEAFQTSSGDESLANYTPEKHRPTALHKTDSETDIKTDLEGFLETCNPTAAEAFTSLLRQGIEAWVLIEENIKAHNDGRLSKEEAIYSNADRWASAITNVPTWGLSLASRLLGDCITEKIELSKSDKSSANTMLAYNVHTFSIIYINNFLVESLRRSYINQMNLNDELDPRRINTQAIVEDLNQNRESLINKFSENLQSIYGIPKSFKEASLDRKIFDIGSTLLGFLVSFLNTGFARFLTSLSRQRGAGENALERELESEDDNKKVKSKNYNKQVKIAVANAITFPSFNFINAGCQAVINYIFKLDSSSQLAQKNLEELISHTLTFFAYLGLKAPMQNGLEHMMHKQEQEKGELGSPFKEIAKLMEPI